MIQDTAPVTLEAYIEALKAHDWFYDYSDDHRVWLRGQESRSRLEAMAQVIDPDHTILKAHMPEGC